MRAILLNNFGWKMLSLALAIAFWLTIKTVSAERADQVERLYINLPVQIVSSTADVRTFKVVPDLVAVTVKGRGDVMKALTEQEIRVSADVTSADVSTPRLLTRRFHVAVPVGITIVRIEPTEAVVEVPSQIQPPNAPSN